jgi:DnaJ-class molecular chaperone
VTVPVYTKPGTRLKVTGKGKKSGRKAGDLYLKIDVRMPKKLTGTYDRVVALINYILFAIHCFLLQSHSVRGYWEEQ